MPFVGFLHVICNFSWKIVNISIGIIEYCIIGFFFFFFFLGFIHLLGPNFKFCFFFSICLFVLFFQRNFQILAPFSLVCLYARKRCAMGQSAKRAEIQNLYYLFSMILSFSSKFQMVVIRLNRFQYTL